MIEYKCWFCTKEIPDKFKDEGVGICWRCGKYFVPSEHYEKPELHKYCSKECRYPLFCNDKCKESFKKLLKKWHGMLDYTSYHYRIGIEKKKLRIYRNIILILSGVIVGFIISFILVN